MERPSRPDVRVLRREPTVRKVLYGAWDTAKKVAESQSPDAWGRRISGAIEKHIIPRLPEESRAWAIDHQEEIREAATYAGVGITTAEIVTAVALGAKAIDAGKYRLELARARRLVQRIPAGDGLPDMPVTIATRRTYATKPETQKNVYENYFQEGAETTQVLRQIRQKWKDIRPAVGDNHWVREQLNGTMATLFDMSEDQVFRSRVAAALAKSHNGVLDTDFQQLFFEAHQMATGRYGWYEKFGDRNLIWKFWNSWFEQTGLDTLQKRATRFVRPSMNLPDQKMAMLFEHLEGIHKTMEDSQSTIPIADVILHPSYAVRRQIRNVFKGMKDKRLIGYDKQWIQKQADRLIRGYDWKNPVLAARFRNESWKHYGVRNHDKKDLVMIIDTVWDIRAKPAVAKLARQFYDARMFGDREAARKLGIELLKKGHRANPTLWQEWTVNHDPVQYFARLYDIWADRFGALGLAEFFERANSTNTLSGLKRLAKRLSDKGRKP